MAQNYKTAIIGGGYSALVLACKLKADSANGSVVIFEKLDRVGKKILSTGNGRGNVCNKILSVENYHGENPEFVSFAIERYNSASVRSFFGDLGMLFVTEEDKFFPASMQANSVLDCLRFKLNSSNVQIKTESNVDSVSLNKEKKLFSLSVNGQIFYAENVVLAFGGCSQKQFGTDGKSFEIAKKLGLKITELSPSLVQMRCKAEEIKGLKGIKQQVKLSLVSENAIIKQTLGDLLFCDSSISGNAVFYLSSYLSGLISPKVVVEFIPEISENRLIDHLLYKISNFKSLDSSELLNGIIHKQIGKIIVKKVTEAKTLGEINTNEIKRIAHICKAYEIGIMGTLGFDYSQVTHGGIATSQFDDKTFECKKINGLYAIGEALDVDGDCGGYNLQWAFSSAMCVAEAINAKNK